MDLDLLLVEVLRDLEPAIADAGATVQILGRSLPRRWTTRGQARVLTIEDSLADVRLVQAMLSEVL